uniref:VGF nerve growth factor inducible n=1 Tax=Neolamprologus brichardi TaxID=32507 RepID=A0A3Q4GDS7_NEOBR
MTRYHNPSSALIRLLLLTAPSFLHLSTSNPLSALDKPYQHTSGLTVSGYRNIGGEESQPMQKQEEAEHEEELFKNVDPKKLAAVLLEALNNSKAEQMSEGEGRDGMEEEMTAEKEEYKNKDSYRKLRTIEGADRDRDGRQELELLMATQRKEQETGEEEERKKAQKEEELTERVTSRTTSHTVEIAREKPPTGSDGRGDNGQSTGSQQGSTSPDQASSEEEEQLSPEELKSLEMMMKEFPALNVPIKREGDSEQSHRESRDYSYNDIMPINKGSDLAITKKKLKWQEETQKALSFPKFRGDNFMDEFDDSNNNSADLQAPREQTMEDDDPDEEEEEDEEVLSPEEEEAQAKGEQEEMRRQAAEAQRAKMEEEMLADIASDMLLRYMVKQNNGNKQYSSSLSSAAEDKRSDEEQEVTEEDDIDPQTIDKLIEISSKLHLPADDVVDIISDVEKKKKKDLSPDVISGWRRPLSPISSPFSSESQISSNQNDIPASNQPFPAAHFLKTWLQKKKPTSSEDLWNKPMYCARLDHICASPIWLKYDHNHEQLNRELQSYFQHTCLCRPAVCIYGWTLRLGKPTLILCSPKRMCSSRVHRSFAHWGPTM